MNIQLFPQECRPPQPARFSLFLPEEAEKTEKTAGNPNMLLFREVYKKNMGDKILVLQITGWKTNKEKTGEWPE